MAAAGKRRVNPDLQNLAGEGRFGGSSGENQNICVIVLATGARCFTILHQSGPNIGIFVG